MIIRETPQDENPAKPAPGGLVLVSGDSDRVVTHVARMLRDDGRQVAVLAMPGMVKEYGVTAEAVTFPLATDESVKVYPVPEASEEAVERVFQLVLAEEAPLTGFIHITDKSKGQSAPVDEYFDQNQQESLKIVFLCAKHFVLSFAPDRGLGFFVSGVRMDGKLGLAGGGDPVQGAYFGLHKSFGIEQDGRILSKAVDLAGDLTEEKAAAYLLEEILQTGYLDMEVGRGTDGKRYTLTAAERYPEIDLAEAGINSGDVLLVTGGARGVTAACAVRLAGLYQCGFMLLGRTDLSGDVQWAGATKDKAGLRKLALAKFVADNPQAKPKPVEIEQMVDAALHHAEIIDTLEAITAAGGRVSYFPCDVRDRQGLTAAITKCEQELGPITGLIHGAGNIADKKIQRKTLEDFDNVFGTKIDGLEACLSRIEINKLKYLIMFSSVAGYFGNSGQSDYAMANEVMNKFAHRFRKEQPGCKTIAVNWGLWDGGSMASDVIRKAAELTDVRLIPLDVGTKYFAEMFVKDPEVHPSQIVINYTGVYQKPETPLSMSMVL